MPLRRPDDPQEVLDVAAHALRLVGGILILGAIFVALVLLLIGGRSMTAEGAGKTLFYFLAGAGFLVAAHFIKRRQRWAAIVAICLTSMAFLAAAIVSVSLLVLIVTAWFHPIVLVAFVMTLLFAFALGHLLHHLTRTFGAIRALGPRPTGFEAVIVSPIAPNGDPHAPAPQG